MDGWKQPLLEKVMEAVTVKMPSSVPGTSKGPKEDLDWAGLGREEAIPFPAMGEVPGVKCWVQTQDSDSQGI